MLSVIPTFTINLCCGDRPVNSPARRHEFQVDSLGRAHESYVEDLAFSPDGKYLVSAASSRAPRNNATADSSVTPHAHAPEKPMNCIRVWDTDTGQLVTQMSYGKTAPLCVAVAADGKTLYAGDESGSIRVWAMPTSTN